MFDVEKVRAEFPILHQEVYGKPLVYLDNAATTQKPQSVIDAVRHYYERDNANVHRGVHALSERATASYEAARDKIRELLNATSRREIIFTRGATEAINLVASSWGMTNIGAGDEVLVSEMEHHSDIVPWQMLCERVGATLKVLPINDAGELCMDQLDSLLGERTRLVGIVHLSNALGTINPVKTIIEKAHAVGAKVLLDGAQALAHLHVDVQALDCDFYVTSAHKMYGPTGIGMLYAKEALLDAMPPYQGGGDMITMVTFEKTQYNDLPYKFEAGTPNIAGAIGFGAAVDWLKKTGIDAASAHENDLLAYATEKAKAFDGLRIIGAARDKASVLSFTIKGVHPHDLGTILDREGVAIRAGHHCAMPVMQHFHVPATARASFAAYNTRGEVDALFAALTKAQELFA
ncbi:MAG: cysteine desulfurase CsdA [Zetaproteobacteria bacterium CG12_big_fil_rev_8_21_14_0_65_55_1124]|nr:MAG: cysteine sulfinate desulfinase [Zetaproteobacteria bacterium CG1_02_55_237]PIS20135.1 MAG: cysteine desulfurase CsdA [Zetaproteobacteria bacterium CG08_land_8_20_14_0_20_55_17]PIW43241.1 MAG: cysteine desulfurase CsdA [Zetaproteobacteria bacterium CG12_big_fil_rev_8_21_14_0_65_55_1124]PIY53195.1 MAG: cysteine desulfurase CsdA [Zetaproteobacteria bacterium CG_4_10_14_0_8_um_filter_55_43]PIZ39709.1 MAG: cysteine desulfurase CsdA [Zetaproteobacteria bacterium CG_4_10_14_0_2_um_filter_55_20